MTHFLFTGESFWTSLESHLTLAVCLFSYLPVCAAESDPLHHILRPLFRWAPLKNTTKKAYTLNRKNIQLKTDRKCKNVKANTAYVHTYGHVRTLKKKHTTTDVRRFPQHTE